MTFDLTPYHIALAGSGAAIILAFWLPRFVGGREPTASALLVVLGAVVLGLVPGMPAVFDPVTNAPAWSVVAEIAVIVALFGTGLRIDNIASFARWTPALRLVLIAMPLTIAAIAGLGLWAGLPLATAVLLGAAFAPTDPVLAGDLQVGGHVDLEPFAVLERIDLVGPVFALDLADLVAFGFQQGADRASGFVRHRFIARGKCRAGDRQRQHKRGGGGQQGVGHGGLSILGPGHRARGMTGKKGAGGPNDH